MEQFYAKIALWDSSASRPHLVVIYLLVTCSLFLPKFVLIDMENLQRAFISLFSLQPTVDIKTVLSQLMDRLSNYAASSTEVSSYHIVIPMHSLRYLSHMFK